MSRLRAVEEAWAGKREDDALNYLPPVFNRTQAKAVGLSDRSIYWLRDEGYIVTIARGLYRRSGQRPPELQLAEIAARAPEATLCLTTALTLHDLCDVHFPVTDVALPRGRHRPRGMRGVAWHAFNGATFHIGRDERRIGGGGLTIGLYNPERCIVDALRLRHREEPHLGMEALKLWTGREGSSVPKLLELARRIPQGAQAVRQALDALR